MTNPENTQPKPCPFCGGVGKPTIRYGGPMFVECDDCGANADIDKWNTRAPQPEPRGIPGEIDPDLARFECEQVWADQLDRSYERGCKDGYERAQKEARAPQPEPASVLPTPQPTVKIVATIHDAGTRSYDNQMPVDTQSYVLECPFPTELEQVLVNRDKHRYCSVTFSYYVEGKTS